MKLLFDQNLAPALAKRLADVFPGSMHVREVGLERAADDAIWRFALDHELAIVTRDSDFQELGQMAATAPRVVWIRRGNCTPSDMEALLRQHAVRINALGDTSRPGFLILL